MKIDCSACKERLLEHLHGELGSQERSETADHLAACGDCAREYCQLDATLQGVGWAVAVAPDATRSRKIRAALASELRAQFAPNGLQRLLRVWSRPIPAYGALVAALLPLCVWGVVAGHDAQSSSERDANQLFPVPAKAVQLTFEFEDESAGKSSAVLDEYDAVAPLAPESLLF